MKTLFSQARDTLWDLSKETWHVSYTLFKLMIPILILVKALEELGAFPYIDLAFQPLMSLVGLPESMGLVWTTTMLTNMYGGMIVFFQLAANEQLTVAQVTVLATLMLMAHSLPVEVRIVQKAGVRLPVALLTRLLGALLLAMLMNVVYSAGDFHQQPVELAWVPQSAEQSLLLWAWDQVQSMAMITVIIGVLLGFLRFLRFVGIERLMIRLLQPLLRFLGVGPEATSLTIIGVTLGLSFGGGLLIQESRAGHVSDRDIFLSLTLLGLCHSMIEDTLLALMMGADVSGVLWMRLVFGLCVVAIVARLPGLDSDRFRARWLVSTAQFRPRSVKS